MASFAVPADLRVGLACVFMLLALCAVAVKVVPCLRPIGLHGKRQARVCEDGSGTLARWVDIRVPKALFAWMYVYGTCAGIVGVVVLASARDAVDLQAMMSFEVQCVRRVLECVFLAQFGTSTMHVGGLVVGLLHYTLVPACFLLGRAGHGSGPGIAVHVLSGGLFVVASAAQCRAHVVLASIKRRGGDGHYEFPRGAGFGVVACPHYAAEVAVYMSWLLLDWRCPVRWALVVWVATNLAVVADSQHAWYRGAFPEEFQKRAKSTRFGWKRLIPGVW